MRELRLIELFAGYGSQAMALKRLEIPFKHWRVVEFDKYAVNSYNAVHGTDFRPTDIRDIHAQDLEIIDTDKNDYLLTYSFPCTDLSLAGKQEGMSRGSGTRSGLLWEVERILKECKELPQYLLMENVPQVHGEQNIKDFGDWISFLDSLGYISKWEDLNAKDYGVAQNRDRCFMVSYLDKSIKYAFPSPCYNSKTIKDYLDNDFRHYSKYILKYNIYNLKTPVDTRSISYDDIIVLGEYDAKNRKEYNRILSVNGILPTLTTCQGGGKKPKVFCLEDGTNYGIIRELTPLEVLRLMDVNEVDSQKIVSINRPNQVYKLAGNSIVVSVMVAIFKNLFLGGSEKEQRQIDIFDIL